MARKALIIVDEQPDFCEGGNLAVDGGNAVCEKTAAYVRNVQRGVWEDQYVQIVTTQDWHIDPGTHFAANGEAPNFVDTWPRHCEANTTGARLHPAIEERKEIDAHFFKGMSAAAYSGFEGVKISAANVATASIFQTLGQYLNYFNITDVDVCGLALDYCVKATALDARKHGFKTTVLTNLTAAVDPTLGAQTATQEMLDAGVQFETVNPY